MTQGDPVRIARDLDALRALTEAASPFTRRAFTPLYLEGRDWLRARMEAQGLLTRVDAAGNLVGTLKGTGTGPSIMVGSHTDTVPGGGLFDGPAGVAAALEVAHLLAGSERSFDLEVIDFLAEEPSDFGLSCIGSRGFAGEITEADLERTDLAGRTLELAMRECGARPHALVAGFESPVPPAAFLELHIEQGPQLEAAGIPLAIVDGVVGIRRWRVTVTGRAGHAGTTPMAGRSDALAAAAELVLAIEREARRRAGLEHFVATVGKLEVRPGGTNVIPGEVVVWLEARALRAESLDDFEVFLSSRPVDASRDGGISWVRDSASLPVAFDPWLRGRLEDAAAARGMRTLTLASGAGHDAARMATVCPSAMVFVPCHAGISHDPAESASATDIALGAVVMADAVTAIAAQMIQGAVR